MKPELRGDNVIAFCPSCQAKATFNCSDGKTEYQSYDNPEKHGHGGYAYQFAVYKLLRCASCGRAGLAEIHAKSVQGRSGRSLPGPDRLLVAFHPEAVQHLTLPDGVPEDIKNEFEEAETCLAHGANRAASALFRSALEKTLLANGFDTGSLYARIEDAAKDGVITDARRQRAHDDIRVLGNDVLHDTWREVPDDEVHAANHYVQRVMEDLYDDRPTVENLLKSKGRLQVLRQRKNLLR